MQTQTLGKSQLLVTRMGIGLAALGRPGYINLGHGIDLEHNYDVDVMQARTFGVLDAAWSAGVRYFDTARSYGRGEEFLGNWLRERKIDPQQIAVGSKWGYTYTANWQVQADQHEVKEHTLALLQRQWAESQANLGAHLDLYQIHSATLDSGVLSNSEVLSALAEYKAQGIAIGFSSSGARQAEIIRKAIELKVDGVRLFDSVQASWSLLETSAGDALAEAHAAGLGVIIKEALANGRLTLRNANPAFAEQRSILTSEAARLGCSPDALAIAAALAQPWADIVLSGASSAAQLSTNLTALHVAYDPEAASKLSTLSEPADIYWANRAALPWN